MKKSFITVFAAIALLSLAAAKPAVSEAPKQSDESLLQGYESYRNGDWTSAMFFLRKAVSVPANSTDETWYMLIMSEMYAGEYKTAQSDCDQFGSLFSLSRYMPLIQYQKGRALHYNGQNEQAVLVLSDFCHQEFGKRAVRFCTVLDSRVVLCRVQLRFSTRAVRAHCRGLSRRRKGSGRAVPY